MGKEVLILRVVRYRVREVVVEGMDEDVVVDDVDIGVNVGCWVRCGKRVLSNVGEVVSDEVGVELVEWRVWMGVGSGI